MKDKFLVKNNSGTLLNLVKNRITIAVGGQIELSARLNKSISELKRDPEISREITYNNLIILEEFDSTKDYELRDKLDTLIGIMSGGKKDQSQPQASSQDGILEAIDRMLNEKLSRLKIGESKQEVKVETKEEIRTNEEDRMRERILEEMISRQKPSEKNFESLGNEKTIEKKDDYSNLIDF